MSSLFFGGVFKIETVFNRNSLQGGWSISEETAVCGGFRNETFFQHLVLFQWCWTRAGVFVLESPACCAASLLFPSELSFLRENWGRNPCFSISFHQNQRNQCAFVFIRLCLKKMMIFTRVVFGYGSGFICVFLLISGGFLAPANLLLLLACAYGPWGWSHEAAQ